MTARADAVRIAAAVALFACAWALLHVGFYEREQIVDTPVYEEYGTAMERGAVPYRDFDVEYPPGALPVFALPALAGGDFRSSFEWLMALCGVGVVVGVGLAARPLGLGFGPLAFVALAPLALGSVILTRFDLWPGALAALALAALVRERLRVGHGLLGAAIAAKLYPVVVLPLALAYAYRRGGRREAVVCGAIVAGVVFVVYLPFLAIAPGGVAASVARQLGRPLQIESLGASLLLGAHHLFGLDVEMRSSHGSQNLVGTGSVPLAIAFSLAQLVALVWLWARFARGDATPARLAAFAAATLTAFVALGKVLSPQFLIWLIPVVPLARRLGATALLLAALVLTQLWFPFRYWDLARELDESVSALVLARNLVLVTLLVVLVETALRRRGREPSRT